MSNAAISTHRNAVCPAAVPADWTMLFSQRLNVRENSPSARNPKNADTTEMFGPNPSLSTTYGYDPPISADTINATMTARSVNSRVPGGFNGAACIAAG